MKNESKNQFNEKPSRYKNLGSDISGAKRHNFDTYENEETKLEKERIKKVKKTHAALKSKAIASLNESNYKKVILDYELNKALENFPDYNGSKEYSRDSITELKNHVLSLKGSQDYFSLVSKFNRVSRLTSRLSYRLTYEDALTYFVKKSKNSFTEHNGVKRPWVLETPFNAESIEFLSKNSNAVQFGNSLPESEREYCLHRLHESLVIFKKYLDFDFKNIGFSFGARGVAGSIAHYQDSAKVIAINRSWDGALVHEIGHAIDYHLGSPSKKLPYSVRSKYREQLTASKVDRIDYYMKNSEIFARLFEVYFRSLVSETTDYMQFTFNPDVMPKLDAESIEFMSESLKSIMKRSF